ncbi:MAG: hypothetical protein IT228_00485 [Flavobacteriales bacterium]|nr:hypothetical protein [Flavobacteriales bacterium]MCC6575796.1 hypothetical protein [Flavobacteriales bacterium]NUQ13963.1 hypothetical protein [Flavobacteriales bacterium]
MYTGLKHFHSYVAYLVLLLVAFAVVHAVLSLSGKRPFTAQSRKYALFGLIAAHVQLLFGLLLYFVSPAGFSNLGGGAMGDAVQRLYALEHPLMMVIGVTLVTIGFSRAKRATEDVRKFKAIAWYYGIGLVLMLSRVPWQVWP